MLVMISATSHSSPLESVTIHYPLDPGFFLSIERGYEIACDSELVNVLCVRCCLRLLKLNITHFTGDSLFSSVSPLKVEK